MAKAIDSTQFPAACLDRPMCGCGMIVLGWAALRAVLQIMGGAIHA